MKTIRVLFAISLTFSVYAAQAQRSLEVTVSNVPSNKGTVRVALFQSSETFLKKPLLAQTIPVNNGKVVVVFENLTGSEYAVSVYHDENDNKKMDSNFFGMPTEAYGFSNNARGSFGPPSFEDAVFTLKEDKNTIEIKVK